MRVRLGVIPDFSGGSEPGMRIDTVLDDGAAKKAGLKDGDRVIKIGDERIRDIYAYMRVLKELKPGTEVDVVFVRDGQEATVRVKFQESKFKRDDQ
jgi:S1-C subfamily serine protease